MAAEPQHKEAVIQPAEGRGQNKKWSDLFWSSSKPSKVFQLRKWNEEDRVIAKDELRNLGYCLVAYILGRFPGRMAVENVQKSWNVASSCSRHESGWLIFRFHSEEDRDLVLMKGPFETQGAPWLMKKLPPFFKFEEGSFCTVPTWIRMKGLPLECWTVNALGKLASFVGEPLAADECTASMSKTSFARILVEVDVTQPLVREITSTLPDGSLLVQEVEYEREPQLCSKCNRIGHNADHCRMLSSNNKARTTKQQQPQYSYHTLQARTEQPPVTNVAGDIQQPSTSAAVEAAVEVEPSKKAPLKGKKVQKQFQVAAVQTTSDASPPHTLQPSADREVLLVGHQSDDYQQEHTAEKYAENAEIVVAHLPDAGQVTMQAIGDPADKVQQQGDGQTHPQPTTPEVQLGTMYGNQKLTPDQQIEEARKAVIEKEFPPLAAAEAGRRMQTRMTPAAKLPAENANKKQQPPGLRAETMLASSDHLDKLQHNAGLSHQQANGAATTNNMQQLKQLQQTAITSDEQITSMADESNSVREDSSAPLAAELQLPKQPAGPKWRQNRKTRSAAKRRGSPT